MCEDIFLSDDMMSEVNLEKMMIASYLGGMAAGYVGVVHPFSAGLSVTLHIRHGIANCYALTVLEDIYPEQHTAFMRMLERQQVTLPKGICRNLSAEEYDILYHGTIVHENSLTNRLGPNFKKILPKENVIERFKRM
jgi:3-deoxy-alpha-D-manno-octulosonate 8-oxidase